MNNTYTPKALVDGYRLGAQHGGMVFVAVPRQKVATGCFVTYRGKSIRITPNQKPVCENTFKDKWNRGSYTLCYFIWEYKNQQPTNFVKEEKVVGVKVEQPRLF